jgi:hypothetical protein
MRIVGYVALAVIAVGVLAGVVTALVSIPDIRRYLKIRAM